MGRAVLVGEVGGAGEAMVGELRGERIAGLDDDRAGLRAMIDGAVEGDRVDVNARRDGETVRFEYPAVVLVAVKGDV